VDLLTEILVIVELTFALDPAQTSWPSGPRPRLDDEDEEDVCCWSPSSFGGLPFLVGGPSSCCGCDLFSIECNPVGFISVAVEIKQKTSYLCRAVLLSSWLAVAFFLTALANRNKEEDDDKNQSLLHVVYNERRCK
jgi:hypothetical protein